MPKKKQKKRTVSRKPLKNSEAAKLLAYLNTTYHKIHKTYEDLFWTSYMGDHSVDTKFTAARQARENFRTNTELFEKVKAAKKTATKAEQKKLAEWEWFFSLYQTPKELLPLFEKISAFEAKINKRQTSEKEGYIDPYTKKFVRASRNQLFMMTSTHSDERVRKACAKATDELGKKNIDDLIKLVAMRNEFARALGYEDFYAYKVKTEEGMTKKELFAIFDTLYEKTKHAFTAVRKMEETMPGLRKPWNKGYMLAGDFTKEADPYFPFEEALPRWGRSFAALGIDYQGGTLQLDLLDRKGKYENGFCHWPDLVQYKNGKRIPGSANFTCNVVYGQVGASQRGYITLFHEGGHAAHLLNSTQTEVCVNNEYPPASTAWDETQSMFLDGMFSSIEWASRYATNSEGETYPFDLFERETKKLHALAPLRFMGILMVMDFERRIYEEPKLTSAKVLKITKEVFLKHSDASAPSLRPLIIPHIYSWESACSYHGYGLAELTVYQWREHFYKKYGYIVDNKKVGKEMTKMWTYASAKPFAECVKLATGKKLSPDAYLRNVNRPLSRVLSDAKKRIEKLKRVKKHTGPIKLGARIKMVHGKKTVADNKSSFEAMSKKYATWLESQRITDGT